MKNENKFKCDDFFLLSRMSNEDQMELLKKMEMEEKDFELTVLVHLFKMTLRELVTLQVVLKHKQILDRSETIILKNINILMEDIREIFKE